MNIEYIDIIKKYAEFKYDWEFLKNKKIMLSGATGLVGRFFIDLIMYKNMKDNLNCTIIGLCRNKHRAEEIFKDYSQNQNLIIEEQDVTEPIKYSKENVQ